MISSLFLFAFAFLSILSLLRNPNEFVFLRQGCSQHGDSGQLQGGKESTKAEKLFVTGSYTFTPCPFSHLEAS